MSLNMEQNSSICELSPWLRMFRWHELIVNHIIITDMPLDHIKHASMFLTPVSGEFNLDQLSLMV
jgi:hypothetical protein